MIIEKKGLKNVIFSCIHYHFKMIVYSTLKHGVKVESLFVPKNIHYRRTEFVACRIAITRKSNYKLIRFTSYCYATHYME